MRGQREMAGIKDMVAVAAADEPVSIDEARRQCRLTGPERDNDLAVFITAARQAIEHACGIAMVQRQFVQYEDEFPYGCGEILLRRGPLESVSAISYVANGSGIDTAWSNAYWQADDANVPPRVKPKYGQSYPSTQPQTYNAVEIMFTAGYADDVLPQPLKQAMLLLISHFEQNPTAVEVGTIATELPWGVKALIANYKTWM